ncbi:MAG TPA: alpha-amylase family glycosyl hydrolase [Desulfomonilia bacterium]|nr:alpha-amylase family glycosyl hydrolase [Desulfomonilia bacterium]
MGVLMQAFYWNCPAEDKREFAWWNHVRGKIADLADVGFTGLWLPPVHKAANLLGPSMGYDPYDYYDLGDYDQKGSVKTWFGSKAELLDLISTAHEQGLSVLADMVINHNNGADGREENPINGQTRGTLFKPKSGRFPRDWECYHPNSYELWDEGTFGDMPDLSHRNPYVYGEIMKLARWLVEEIGFDGFRYDFVKGYGAWAVTAIQEYRYLRQGKPFIPYGVAEHWSSAKAIENWVNVTNFSHINPVGAFDFPLREMLKALCDQYGFSLLNLSTWETVLQKKPETAVTFVENHDLRDEGRPIINDKLLAYSYILTHEGYPCIFWKDYYNYDLAMEKTPNGIAALVRVHEDYAGGGTQVLYLDDELYIMQRCGYGGSPGLVYALNNNGDRWRGAWVKTRWGNTEFVPTAWWSRMDTGRPMDQGSEADGGAQFWAPPRGYVVYAPRV